jgi:hypothetical protein
MKRGGSILKTVMIAALAAQLSAGLSAQRINFSVWAGSNSITILPVSANSTLSFGTMFTGQMKTILLTANETVAFEISAETGYDLTITLDASTVLSGPSGKTMPFDVRFAYSNQGIGDFSMARPVATEVPQGYTSVTFPLKKFSSGIPAPPPSPVDGRSSARPRGKAFLFIYGSAGPSARDAAAGEYTGSVSITVEYSQ